MKHVHHYHDDVIKWKHFPRYWLFVWGIHRSPVNPPHKGQWRGPLMFTFICVWINNREAGDLRRYRDHYDITLMSSMRISYYHQTKIFSCNGNNVIAFTIGPPSQLLIRVCYTHHERFSTRCYCGSLFLTQWTGDPAPNRFRKQEE